MTDKTLHPIETQTLVALGNALRALPADDVNTWRDPASPTTAARVATRESFLAAADRILGGDLAAKLLHGVESTEYLIEDLLAMVRGATRVHVALYDGPGQDTQVVVVFGSANMATDWVRDEPLGSGVHFIQEADFIPMAPPVLPQELTDRQNMEMLAADLAKAISRYGYAEMGLDVDDRAILAVLPQFVAGALTEQARLDAQGQD